MNPSSVPAFTPSHTSDAGTFEGLTRGRDINLYGVYTLKELSVLVPYRYTWLLEMSQVKQNPLPTIKRGKVQTIVYADFLEWLRKLYGINGIYRGQEILELGSSK